MESCWDFSVLPRHKWNSTFQPCWDRGLEVLQGYLPLSHMDENARTAHILPSVRLSPSHCQTAEAAIWITPPTPLAHVHLFCGSDYFTPHQRDLCVWAPPNLSAQIRQVLEHVRFPFKTSLSNKPTQSVWTVEKGDLSVGRFVQEVLVQKVSSGHIWRGSVQGAENGSLGEKEWTRDPFTGLMIYLG